MPPIVIAGLPCRISPAVAAATSPAVSVTVSTRYDTRVPARRRRLERIPGNVHVIERQHAIPDRLRLLVTLPRDEHQIPGPRVGDRFLDGRPAIDDGEARCGGQRPSSWRAVGRHHDAALDLLDDSRRVFRARVVGSDDYEVAQARGDGSHQRTLRAVPIAAASEDRDDSSGRQRARCLQQILQRIVGVRVVDHDPHLVSGIGDELEAAGNTGESRDALLRSR